MTACPIRYQRQVPDRKGKIFYTSITSLSHISKCSRYEPAYNKEKTQPSDGGIKNREQAGKWRIMMKFINNEKILEKYKKRYYNAQ